MNANCPDDTVKIKSPCGKRLRDKILGLCNTTGVSVPLDAYMHFGRNMVSADCVICVALRRCTEKMTNKLAGNDYLLMTTEGTVLL